MTGRDPTRRAVFGGMLALAVSACEPLRKAQGQPVSPELRTLRRAAAHEESLIARCEAVRRRHPRLASRIQPIADEHRAHLAALRGQVTPSPTPSASGSPSAKKETPSVPARRRDAVGALAAQERAAADARISDLDTAPPFLAQLLASIGASEATHAALLEDDSG